MPSFTPPPAAPQRGDRATFSSRVDAFLTWLVQLIPQLAAFQSDLGVLSAGGANSFGYALKSGTADIDPGSGRISFGGPQQTNSTILRMNTFSTAGANVYPVMLALLAVTNNIKGSIRFQVLNDVSRWIIFDISSGVIGPLGGYLNFTGQVRTSSSSGNIFTESDQLICFFSFRGDKGDGGGTPTQQQIRDAVGTMPIANGGTGATTAEAARMNLGVRSSTDVIPIANGGTGTNNAASALVTLGALPVVGGRMSGPLVLNNNIALRMRYTGGGEIDIAYIGGDNWLNYFGASPGTRWWNAEQNAILASLSNTGEFSAIKITQTSDETLKQNWQQLSDEQLDALADMDLVGSFDWTDGSGSSVGGSAQQIQRIVPQAVRQGANGMLGVDYGGLNFAIIQAQLRRAKREIAK